VLTERISQLQAETQDLREQNELLEFRILELEECHDNVSQTTAATVLNSGDETTC
jgi:prefoldin subunit 5